MTSLPGLFVHPAAMHLILVAILSLPGVGRPSYPRVRAGGKVTPAKSQFLVIYAVKFRDYFANRVANLAKRQSPLASAFGGRHGDTTPLLLTAGLP